MTNFVRPYITHGPSSFPLLCQEIQGPHLTICPTHEPLQTWVGVERRSEWTERIHGPGRGYYLSGHGSLHIFHGSRGVFSQLLAECIHLKHLWVTCGLLSALWKNKWDEKQMRRELTGHHNAANIQLLSVQLWPSQSSPYPFLVAVPSWRGDTIPLRRWQTRWQLSIRRCFSGVEVLVRKLSDRILLEINDFTYSVWFLFFSLFFFFASNISFLSARVNDNEADNTSAKQSKAKRCSSCCNFLADMFLICIPGMMRLLMRFAEAQKWLASLLSLFFYDIFGSKIYTTD